MVGIKGAETRTAVHEYDWLGLHGHTGGRFIHAISNTRSCRKIPVPRIRAWHGIIVPIMNRPKRSEVQTHGEENGPRATSEQYTPVQKGASHPAREERRQTYTDEKDDQRNADQPGDLSNQFCRLIGRHQAHCDRREQAKEEEQDDKNKFRRAGKRHRSVLPFVFEVGLRLLV